MPIAWTDTGEAIRMLVVTSSFTSLCLFLFVCEGVHIRTFEGCWQHDAGHAITVAVFQQVEALILTIVTTISTCVMFVTCNI